MTTCRSFPRGDDAAQMGPAELAKALGEKSPPSRPCHTPAVQAVASAGAGFLLAVLWFDLMFDVQVGASWRWRLT